MKKQILKIAGVKSEKEFYKKFPTEEAFMKAHGKAFKKAQIGTYMTSGEASAPFQPLDVQGMQSDINYAVTGMTDAERRQLDALQAKEPAKKGKKIPKAQIGYPTGPQLTPAAGQSPVLQFEPAKGTPDTSWLGDTSGGTAGSFNAMPYIGAATDVIRGAQMMSEQRDILDQARQQEKLSGVFAQAAMSRPVQQPRRQYLRPEDVVIQPEQMFPSYGVGTNVLAEDGTMIGGNPTEIQNMYNPGTLYTDLAYEPLNDTSKVKNYKKGGKLDKAEFGNQNWMQGTGFGNFMTGGGGRGLQNLGMSMGMGDDAGSQIGKGIGKGIGTAFGGPVGGAVGGFIGSALGDVLDPFERKMRQSQQISQRNIGNIMGQSAGFAIQNQFGLRDGGDVSPYEWVSHTWQPQKIVKFGEHSVKDLLKPPHDADMLRAGGHLKEYTPPSERAMSTERPAMQMGGELQTHWGGYAEPMSQNPYLPDGGETIMFRGQSHDESDGKGNTGIGITYGDNPVEVERGEPAMKMKDGSGGDSSLVVFGNLKIPNSYLPFLGEDAKGKKFKTYVADLSKKENKQNKKLDKATNMLSDLEVSSPIDKLTLNSLQYTMLGANQKLKDLAEKKITAASLQNAINDTAEEMGLVADDLAKGKVKVDKKAMKEAAKFGKMIKAQGGAITPPVSTKEKVAEIMALYNRAKEVNAKSPGKKNPFILELQKKYHEYFPEIAEKIILNASGVTARAKSKGITSIEDLKKLSREEILDTNLDEYFGPRTEQYIAALPKKDFIIPDGELDIPTRTEITDEETPTTPVVFPITPYKRNGIFDLIGALPNLRPTDVEGLDPRQLIGEMYALSTNELEPVQAQTIQPQLGVPYDISLQDILNENEATFRSQQRMIGYNPAAQSQLSAQKYQANQRVLGEQFRLNQAMKDQVYRENRNLLNEFGLKNLEILDRQYVRQAEAKSKTKAVTQAALNSIGDKFMRNQLENRTLATYENLYNYRYDPRFRAINMNAPFQPQIPTVYVGPDGRQYQQIPSMATPPIVPQGRVPAAAPSASQVQPFTPINFEPRPYTMEELSGGVYSGKTGVKVDKKKSLNSSVLKAFKNL